MLSCVAKSVVRAIGLLAFGLTFIPTCDEGWSQETSNATGGPNEVFVGRIEHNLGKAPNEAILIGLPKAISTDTGELLVYPNAMSTSAVPDQERNGFQFGKTRQSTIFSDSGDAPMALTPQEYTDRSSELHNAQSILDYPLGTPGYISEPSPYKPIFQHLDLGDQPVRNRFGRLCDRLFGCDYTPSGIGSERLGYSMFLLDNPPLNNTRLRFNAFFNQDRLFDGKPPFVDEEKPSKFKLFDSQELRLQFEVGSPKFSVTTELPYVAINPDSDDNHSGYGDMSITTKTVLKDGNNVQVTQIFRSFIPSGNFDKKIGVGHASFETGAMFRRKFRPQTEFAGEVLYHWPAGDGEQIMKWGLGMTHVAYDSDDFAILPSLEFTGWSIVDQVSDGKGFHFFSLTPALRFAFDRPGDLGLFDAGFAASIPLSQDRWYSTALMLELRWTF